MTAPPFRRTARRRVAENTRFEVFFDRLEGGGGRVVPEYLMLRPKVLVDGFVSGICVLPEVAGRIGLMKAHRHQFGEELWQAPAGFAEPGESPAGTARRELVEETGLDCAPEDLVPLGLVVPDAGFLEAKVAIFVARACHPVTAAPSAQEEPGLGALTFFDREGLGALLAHSTAMGAATMIACYRWLALR